MSQTDCDFGHFSISNGSPNSKNVVLGRIIITNCALTATRRQQTHPLKKQTRLSAVVQGNLLQK